MKTSSILALVAIALMVASTWGCGARPIEISGTVTLDGKPLDEAAIHFVPAALDRRKTGCPIKQGKYLLPAENGLLPGVYRVDIMDLPPMTHSEAPRRSFPHRYATRSPLSLKLKQGGQTTFDFELTSP